MAKKSSRDSIDKHGIYRPLKKFARTMKRFPTPAENHFWKFLVAQRGIGQVLRQRTFGWYILDFVFIRKLVVIELDGSSHDERAAYDSRRDDWIKRNGLSVLRFDNSVALKAPDEILRVVSQMPDHPTSEWNTIFKLSKEAHADEKRAALLAKGECFDRQGKLVAVAGLGWEDMSNHMRSKIYPERPRAARRSRPRCACGRGIARAWTKCKGCGVEIVRQP